MRRLLVINPNTSQGVSDLLCRHGQKVLGPDAEVIVRTARFGAPYIASEASYAVAGHGVLDTWAEALADEEARFDSVLIGCFGDPGLHALREVSQLPVTGLAEASFIEAAALGRFAIVTGGERWRPILNRLADSLGFGGQLAGIQTVAPSGAHMAADPVAAHKLLAEACIHAARSWGVQAIIVGGAGLAGMAELLQPMVPVPLIDSVTAAMRHALLCAQVETLQSRRVFDFAWKNVSLELARLGEDPRL